MSSGLLKNSRRSRCQRHGSGCKASRRRRCLSTSSRSDNTAGGAVPRQPSGRKGLGAICFVPARHKSTTLISSPRLAPRGPALGKALGALLPWPEQIPGGPTMPCLQHGQEGQRRRCPATGQPGGTPRPGRSAVFRFVGDVPASCSSPRRAEHPRAQASRQRPSRGPDPRPQASCARPMRVLQQPASVL